MLACRVYLNYYIPLTLTSSIGAYRETSLMWDVAIVGGGPGGLYAARSLARRGFGVHLIEEHYIAGKPVHCTGIVSPGVFDDFVLPGGTVLSELKKIRFFSALGQTFEYKTESAEALVIDRHLFDQGLCKSSQDAGVELSLGEKVTGIAVQSTHVDVKCSDGKRIIRARAAIIATGVSYGLQRSLGFGLPPLYLNSAQAELPVTGEGEAELQFGTGVAPLGFAWVVPVRRESGNHARIGLMCQGDAGLYFSSLLDRVGKRWGIDVNENVSPRQRILPLAPIRKTFADRLLVVGDAAGMVKPTTGGGIYYSLVSAAIAAEVLADGLRQDRLGEPVLQEYERQWRHRFTEEFHAQLTLRLLAQRLTDAEIEEMFELANTDGLIPLVRKTAKFNQHRDLIVALVKYPSTRRILFKRLFR